MRLLTLNLRHGGGRRMPALLTYLLRHEADVLVLTEHRHNPASSLLREGLREAGYAHQLASHDVPRVNHLLVAARLPLTPAPQRLLRVDRVRLLPVRVGGLLLVGVHLPNLKAKLPHWNALLKLAGRLDGERAVFMGDFNSGHHVQDVERPPFPFSASYEAYMGALEARGWADAWRRLHPEAREYSWYSHRQRGFRLDHAFLSPACLQTLRAAAFDHSVRESGASDHSALWVELDE
ncbi:MAG TPA: endonuclease/exonuclease/phosphatase family protein [bacterium]|nr:endonuclease/exonuclease/phosphatase family protein [bacterium]